MHVHVQVLCTWHYVKHYVHRLLLCNIDAFGRWASSHDWFGEFDFNTTVDNLTNSFSSHMVQAIDRFFPSNMVKRHFSDKHWISPSIKSLIRDRQRAFHSHNTSLWQSLKRKVQYEIAERKKSFYRNNVQHLKSTDCRKWWRMINKMSGKPEKTKSFSLERNGITLNENLATTLNQFYVSVNADIPTLDVYSLPAFLPSSDEIPTVEPHEVCRKLLTIQKSKNGVPNRILKEFAHVLAKPITIIFNASLSSCVMPSMWKEANVTSIPNVQQPESEGDTRPISLTLCISKVLEDFVVRWLIEDIKGKIDPCQFGCLKGTSTTYCSLDMFHTCLSHLDSHSKHIRICFLDFSKAFDRIGYNVLINKLIDLGVRRSLIPWIINFLSG